MTVYYLLGGIVLQIIGFILLVAVLLKQKKIKPAIDIFKQYQDYIKGGSKDMKKEQLKQQLLAMGVNAENIDKMLAVVDTVIEVREVYNGVDKEVLYQAGQLLKVRKGNQEVYYSFNQEVK